ncbi:MAG: hypothetical protein ACJA0I_001813, partial [Gammaproteobacteria bacterium]
MRRPIFYVVVPNDQLMPKPMIKSKRQSSSLLPLVVQNLSFRVGEKL